MISTRPLLLMSLALGCLCWPPASLLGEEPNPPASDVQALDQASPWAEDDFGSPEFIDEAESPPVPPGYRSEQIEFSPAPDAIRARGWSDRRGVRQARRTPSSIVSPYQLPSAKVADDIHDLEDREEFLTPPRPTIKPQRPAALGRWMWLPDPSEIRAGGFFDPDREAEQAHRERGSKIAGFTIRQRVEPVDHEELFSPWAPSPPPLQPTARGRWIWLPEPSEFRGNGFFSPDVVDAPREIGPTEAVFHDDLPPAADDFSLLEKGSPVPRPTPQAVAEDLEELGFPTEQPPCGNLEEIADLMAQNPGVTDGSLFAEETDDCPGHGECQPQIDRRQAALRHLRRIESERTPDISAEWTEPRTLEATKAEQHVADSIRTMRETSFDLEVAAQRLEEQQLYYRADQLREFAAQLRQEARSAMGGWSLKRLYPQTREAPVGAERDLGRELEQLRDELYRVREALKQQAETPPRR